MDFDLFKKIIDDCKGHQVRIWLHFLGEPLLNPSLFDMIDYAKAQNMSEVGFSSNAAFLKEEHINRLLDTGLDRLEFSVDALDSRNFLQMRGVDEFEKVKSNVTQFLRIKKERNRTTPITSIQFMRTKESENNSQKIIDTWKPLLFGDDFVMMIDEHSFLNFDRRTQIVQKYFERTPCGWLWEYMLIFWNGDIPLCASDYEGTDVLGNVKNDSISNIFNSGKVDAYRNQHRNREFGKIANCSSCEVWKTAKFNGYEHESYKNILIS